MSVSDSNEIDLQVFAKQYQGRPFAALIWEHVQASNMESSLAALQGHLAELPESLHNHVTEFLDYIAAVSSKKKRHVFHVDCGEQFKDFIETIVVFFMERANVRLTVDQAMSVFHVLVQNYVYSCHKHAPTKRAMQQAANGEKAGKWRLLIVILLIIGLLAFK